MAITVIVMEMLLAHLGWQWYIVLAIKIATGVITYGLMVVLLMRELTHDIFIIIKRKVSP